MVEPPRPDPIAASTPGPPPVADTLAQPAGSKAGLAGSVELTPLLEAIEACYEAGWTDGLPVVPPTPALVEAFLAHTRRDPDEVVWRMPQVYRACTVRLAAVNAAMAGCRPEYLPVVLAALEATIDEGWPAAGGWQSTTGGRAAPSADASGPSSSSAPSMPRPSLPRAAPRPTCGPSSPSTPGGGCRTSAGPARTP